MEKSLSVVIPCLNEEAAAASVLQTVAEVRNYFLNVLDFKDVQVIVVDDASQDRSAEIIRQYPFIELHQHQHTMGYGASLRTGFENSRGQWICFFDMDNSYPPHHILPMWRLLVTQELDMILGRRSFRAEGMSLVRGFGNWLFSFLARSLLKTPINDVCSGFRLFKKDHLPEVLSISENTLGFSLEMSIRLGSLGLKTKEYEIEYLPRKGDSKLSVWKDGWTFLTLIFTAVFRHRIKRETVACLKS